MLERLAPSQVYAVSAQVQSKVSSLALAMQASDFEGGRWFAR